MIYWASIGTLYLILLTYQDYAKKMMVDDRFNYFMIGVTYSLLSHFKVKIWYLAILILLIMFFNFLIKRYNMFAAADQKTIMWCFLGFGIIHIWLLVFYLLVLLCVTLIHWILRKVIFEPQLKPYHRKIPIQGYPILLVSFIFTVLVLMPYYL